MLYLLAAVGLATIAVLLWKSLAPPDDQPSQQRSPQVPRDDPGAHRHREEPRGTETSPDVPGFLGRSDLQGLFFPGNRSEQRKPTQRRRTIGPDDDPEFLRELDRRNHSADDGPEGT